MATPGACGFPCCAAPAGAMAAQQASTMSPLRGHAVFEVVMSDPVFSDYHALMIRRRRMCARVRSVHGGAGGDFLIGARGGGTRGDLRSVMQDHLPAVARAHVEVRRP